MNNLYNVFLINSMFRLQSLPIITAVLRLQNTASACAMKTMDTASRSACNAQENIEKVIFSIHAPMKRNFLGAEVIVSCNSDVAETVYELPLYRAVKDRRGHALKLQI